MSHIMGILLSMPTIATLALEMCQNPPTSTRCPKRMVFAANWCLKRCLWLALLFGLGFLTQARACSNDAHRACTDVSRQAQADNLLKRVRASLVDIDTGLTRIRGEVGHASGFVTGQPNWVVTNVHAIESALNEPEDMRVTVKGSQDQRLSARVIALDARNDLALLETGLPLKGEPLKLAPDDPVAGQYVVAIGSPSSQGFIVKGGRLEGPTSRDALRLRATIEAGMSGGPVLDEQGRVVGVNRAIFLEGPRNSSLVALGPLRRLLEQARQSPYPNDAALRQGILNQHRAMAVEMTEAWSSRSSARDQLGPFQVSAHQDACEGSRFQRPEDHFNVYRIRCENDWNDESKYRLPLPGHRMTHYWIHNPKFHDLQSARAGDYMLDYLREDAFTQAHRHRSNWECRYSRLTNTHGLTLDLHACRRQHLNWRGFADHRLRALALVPGSDVLVSVLDLDAFDAESARRITSIWLDGLQHRPEVQVNRSRP
jgi:serine protease Do